jgi:hypothetical protein
MTGCSVAPESRRTREGLPGNWVVLFVRAEVVHPAGCVMSSPSLGHHAVAFRLRKALGTRDWDFGAAFLPAQTFAYLRIAAHVAEDVARLATERSGSDLTRAGFAPAGRRTGFPSNFALAPPS